MKSGIYQISFLEGKYTYIGSAVNLVKRKGHHVSGLKRGKHFNAKMQNIWNKHSATFEFSIIQHCDNESLQGLEQFFLDKLNPNINILKKAYHSTGYKHSKESLEKLKAINKKNAANPEFIEKVSKTWFKKGRKVSDAEIEAMRERMKGLPGRKPTYESRLKMSIAKKGKKLRSDLKDKFVSAGANASKKKVVKLSSSGEVIGFFESMKDAAISVGSSYINKLSAVCRCKKEYYKGYKWEFHCSKKHGEFAKLNPL